MSFESGLFELLDPGSLGALLAPDDGSESSGGSLKYKLLNNKIFFIYNLLISFLAITQNIFLLDNGPRKYFHLLLVF